VDALEVIGVFSRRSYPTPTTITASTLLVGWSVDPQLGGPMRFIRTYVPTFLSLLLAFPATPQTHLIPIPINSQVIDAPI